MSIPSNTALFQALVSSILKSSNSPELDTSFPKAKLCFLSLLLKKKKNLQ